MQYWCLNWSLNQRCWRFNPRWMLGGWRFDPHQWGLWVALQPILNGGDPCFINCDANIVLHPWSLASHTNAYSSRFFSRYPFPGSISTDAFSISWAHEVLFVTPSIGKLISTWKKSFFPLTLEKGLLYFLLENPSLSGQYFSSQLSFHLACLFCSIFFYSFICLGQFYAGVMNGKNDYLFIAIFFDTSLYGPSPSSLCHLPSSSCFTWTSYAIFSTHYWVFFPRRHPRCKGGTPALG